jgi:hypothetical protein
MKKEVGKEEQGNEKAREYSMVFIDVQSVQSIELQENIVVPFAASFIVDENPPPPPPAYLVPLLFPVRRYDAVSVLF